MKTRLLSIHLVCSLLVLLGCRRSLPEAYGIYADTNHGRLLLGGQAVVVVGNLNPIPGLAGPSGAECSSLQDFIVYAKDVSPAAIRLTRLGFVDYTQAPGFFMAPTHTKVDLWLPGEVINVEVKPIEERRDMYIIAPRTTLDKGLYALYLGSFGSEFGMHSWAYDIVVGSATDFPSYQARLDHFRKDATRLITKTNDLLNRRDYGQLADVYRPGGKILAGAELRQFVNGNQTWLASAGKIVRSDVTAVSPSDDGNLIHCSVTTTYEKSGPQKETVIIEKVGDQYFITEIQ